MDVICDLPDGIAVSDIPVVTTTSLPEPKVHTITLLNPQRVHHFGIMLCVPRSRQLRDRPLDGREYSADLVRLCARVNQQMYMLGHDDISNKRDLLRVPHNFQRINEPLA
jgi:hypothetical protein